MANERAILCDSAGDGSLPFEDPRPLRLRMWGPHRNVKLTIQDVRRSLMKALPPVFRDLIDIATYVYCADQATTRGGEGVADFGENWRRTFFFRIPVRDRAFWTNPPVHNLLVSTLSFLSEDEYHFDFEPLTKDHSFENLLGFNSTPFDGIVEEVVMFSAGIDSLGGAVQETIIDKRKILLVNHRSSGKLVPRHTHLLNLLAEKAKDCQPLHFPVTINKSKKLSREYTQRTRSFLYASLGATFATMIGLPRLRFYENGIVSLNLPPSPQVVGARATRTTHPQVLNGFSQLFTLLAGRTFTVENPFLSKTKTEVVRLIGDAGCGDLLKFSTSCTHTWEMTKQHMHCGVCSQCIDRRFAILAANQETNDPAEAYRVDLLVGERKTSKDNEVDPRTMLASYLERTNEIEGMNAVQFFSRFGEASRILRHMGGNADATGMQVFDLHRRHAKQVTGVIEQGIAKHKTEIRKRALPPTCLLRLVYESGQPTAPVMAIAPAGTTSPSAPVKTLAVNFGGDNVFKKKGQAWVVRFAGSEEFILLPSKGAAYLHQLLSKPRVRHSAIDMAFSVAKNRDRYALGDAGEKSDHEALAAYHAKLLELREDLQEAKDNNDHGNQVKIQEEIEVLAKQIRESHGLRGRIRKDSDDRERVRKSVGIAVKRAIKDIAQFDQRLADHLTPPRLSCGQNPLYLPDQDIEWEV
jgi:hypothetical protein